MVDAFVARRSAAAVVDAAAGDDDLLGSAALLAQLDLLVTGDTGPMHLAAAVGTPVVAIFGPSDPARYATVRAATIASSASICPAAPAIASAARRHDASATRRTASSHVSADAVSTRLRSRSSTAAAARCAGADPAMNDVVIAVRSACRPRARSVSPTTSTAEAAERAADDAMAWIKRLRHARVDGDTLRRRFTYRGDSLWWFAELYLHKQQVVAGIFRTIAALEQLLDREAPRAIEIVRPGVGTTTRLIATVAPQIAAAAGVGYEGQRMTGASSRRARRDGRAGEGADRGRAGVARARTRPVSVPAHSGRGSGVRAPRVLAPAGAATAATKPTSVRCSRRSSGNCGAAQRQLRHRRPGVELPGPAVVASAARRAIAGGPAQPIEAFAPLTRLSDSRRLWRERHRMRRALWASDDVRALAQIRGCDCWPLIREELAGVALLQWPWSARAMDEAGAALDALQPRVAVTYAEAGGWGRAIVLECRRRGIPSVGLQHGFIYRHWLNYLHEPDEMQADREPTDRLPRPDVDRCSSTTTPPITCAQHGRFPAERAGRHREPAARCARGRRRRR